MHSEPYPTLAYLRQRQRRILSLSTLCSCFMIVVVLVSACGGPSKNSSGSKTGGMVTVLNGGAQLFTDNFNPWLYTHNIGTQGLIYETLFHWNRQDGSITPLLATNEQFTDNNTGITITTRQGVKWSDGQPFSADDVLFTFHLTSTFPGADTSGLGEEIKSITEPDSNTIHITLKKAYEHGLMECFCWKHSSYPNITGKSTRVIPSRIRNRAELRLAQDHSF